MKLRPVLLVLVLLSGFYYLTTRVATTGSLARWVQHGVKPMETEGGAITGPLSLTTASAAPAFDSEEQQNIAVYKKALPSVVNITSTAVAFNFFYGPVPQQGQGSGFILNKDGLILTNNHVINNAQRVEVTLSDKHKYKATVLTVDKGHDLALIKINNVPNLVPATLAESHSLIVGQRVYAIGNPFGLSGTMTRGIVSAIRSIRGQEGNPIEDAIQTDAAVNPGNSGGPLLNSRGEVIGITTMIASNGADQSSGIGFAIPIDTAKAVLDDFAKYGRVRRPSLDIVTLPIGPDIAQQIGLPSDYGILIERVLPGGAAEKAGLHGGTQKMYDGNVPVMLGGDLIVAMDGQEIASPQDLSAAMNTHRAGDTVTLTVFRGQKKLSVKVTLGDAKDTVPGSQGEQV
ncbi:S1C family serine protease [Granulicella arctica]|uniref:S1-C subfamily serine protease n=1 Tax=Granulicella arctica TaxID=940613 RepID=A0A7Y9PFK1_9BACT|nr:trypsin-like peptidase domain-containing protein [Granulicella arctica]NYF78243.1 S1-C subfamily serine protease [Granulicella arctica]